MSLRRVTLDAAKQCAGTGSAVYMILSTIGPNGQRVDCHRLLLPPLMIGVSTISSGASGYETPTGSYTILQKNLTHKSNLYDDAPMPFMQRLTWDGVALHAGAIPGHPASHGCVRLPKSFAKLLYGATRVGTTVTITGDSPILDSETVETIAAMSDAEEPGVRTVSLPYKISQR